MQIEACLFEFQAISVLLFLETGLDLTKGVTMRKAERHALIRQIISTETVRTQEELLKHLEDRGVLATQATISRDIRDLKIVKVQDKDGAIRFELFNEYEPEPEDPEEENRLIRMIQEVVTKVDRVQFITIINTMPDNAQLLSAVMDEVKLPEKVTTLAGFDTVITICRTDEDAEKLAAYFRSHMLN